MLACCYGSVCNPSRHGELYSCRCCCWLLYASFLTPTHLAAKVQCAPFLVHWEVGVCEVAGLPFGCLRVNNRLELFHCRVQRGLAAELKQQGSSEAAAAPWSPQASKHTCMHSNSHHTLSPATWCIYLVDVQGNVQPARSRSKSLPGVQCLYRHFAQFCLNVALCCVKRFCATA
jgi:hypothetical protein